jgi:protein transport protein SEC20
MLIFAGLALFALVVLFILKQRIVDRGLRIAFWWTRLLPSMDRGDSPLGVKEVTMEKGPVTLQSVAVVTSSTIAATAAALVSQVHHPAESDWNALTTSTLEMDTSPTSVDLGSAGFDLLATTSTPQMGEMPSFESIHDEL